MEVRKKWILSGGAIITVLFGPSNLIGTAEIVSASLADTSKALQNKILPLQLVLMYQMLQI
ncbi:hypothetical protein [Lactococcus petauri]|uniref:hypothetical protein n=1 Tax=Lactococcus petauri TaxID=1940789 RepID=UPI0038579355